MDINFKTENGILLNYEGSEAVVVIPEGIMEIGKNARFLRSFVNKNSQIYLTKV